MTVFPAFRISFRFMVGTESAVIDADISGLDVKVPVEKGKIAIMSSSCNTGKQVQGQPDRHF